VGARRGRDGVLWDGIDGVGGVGGSDGAGEVDVLFAAV